MQISTTIEESIVKAVTAANQSRWRWGLGIACIGVVLVILSATGSALDMRLALGAAALVVVGGVLVRSSLGDPRRDAGLEVLRSMPAERLVWLFRSRGRYGRGSYVSFGFDDGKLGTVVVHDQAAEALLEELERHAPRALSGFSHERLARYQRAPHAFLDQPD